MPRVCHASGGRFPLRDHHNRDVVIHSSSGGFPTRYDRPSLRLDTDEMGRHLDCLDACAYCPEERRPHCHGCDDPRRRRRRIEAQRRRRRLHCGDHLVCVRRRTNRQPSASEAGAFQSCWSCQGKLRGCGVVPNPKSTAGHFKRFVHPKSHLSPHMPSPRTVRVRCCRVAEIRLPYRRSPSQRGEYPIGCCVDGRLLTPTIIESHPPPPSA